MYHYTGIQWLFFFYFYCFCGWCFESAYVSAKSRRWVNRGFIRGPFLPLYGSGAIMMLLVSRPFVDNLFWVYVAGCIGATILEYVTGVVMEALFKVRYWDYSNQKFQFQGHICLSSSLAWGFLTILMTEFVHRPVERLAFWIPSSVLIATVSVLTVVIGADFALSFKAAIDLRNVLLKMEKVKEEMARIQKRLDVVIAVTQEDITDSISARRDSYKEEIAELKRRYQERLEEKLRLGRLKNFFQRDLIRSHPSMSSLHFKEALEELKENLGRK